MIDSSIDSIAVVIPAADEQQHIAACLTSVDRAAAFLSEHRPVPVRIVVVLDRCRDATADIVALRPDVRTVSIDARNVGTARRTGAELAGTLAPGASDRVWVANTDADSVVPPDWFAHMIDCANAGADLVVGTVRPAAQLAVSLRTAWTLAHRLTAAHPHVHGANLGIRASMLAGLGGWSELATGEDVDLVDRAVAAGAAVWRTDVAPVVTSSRSVGRAPGGFAAYLGDLASAASAVDAQRPTTSAGSA